MGWGGQVIFICVWQENSDEDSEADGSVQNRAFQSKQVDTETRTLKPEEDPPELPSAEVLLSREPTSKHGETQFYFHLKPSDFSLLPGDDLHQKQNNLLSSDSDIFVSLFCKRSRVKDQIPVERF